MPSDDSVRLNRQVAIDAIALAICQYHDPDMGSRITPVMTAAEATYYVDAVITAHRDQYTYTHTHTHTPPPDIVRTGRPVMSKDYTHGPGNSNGWNIYLRRPNNDTDVFVGVVFDNKYAKITALALDAYFQHTSDHQLDGLTAQLPKAKSKAERRRVENDHG